MKTVLDYSVKFFKRNPYLSVIYIFLACFTSIIVLKAGWGGVGYMIFTFATLSAIFTFFRIPLRYREWLDLDDWFTCVRILFEHNPDEIKETRRYDMTTSRSLIVMLYRILWVAGSGLISWLSVDFEKYDTGYSPYIAIGAFATAILAGMLFGAYIARKSEKYYTDGIDNEII